MNTPAIQLRRLAAIALAIASTLTMTRNTIAQDAPTQPARPASGDPDARARWERLTPRERAILRDRFERYRKLSAEEKTELTLRARRLKEQRARVDEELTPEQRERLARLRPERRRELVDAVARERAREVGRRVRDKLPPALVKRLETATPEERARMLTRFKKAQREHRAARAVEELGRRLDLPREERERIARLPHAEREEALLRLCEQWAEREGLNVEPARLRSLWRLRDAARPHVGDMLEDDRDTSDTPRQRWQEATRRRCMDVLRETELVPRDRLAELEQLPFPSFMQRMRQLVAPVERFAPRGRPSNGERDAARQPNSGERDSR